MGGSSQSQNQGPSVITDALAKALAAWIFGPQGIQQFTGRNLKGSAFAQGGGAGQGGQAGGGQNPLFQGSQFNVNPQALISGQGQGLQAGNIPGSILPNFNNLLELSGRSFFGSLNPELVRGLRPEDKEIV